jgi:hypothetical protein
MGLSGNKMFCYAIIGAFLSSPVIVGEDYTHDQIVTSLNLKVPVGDNYICSQRELGDIVLYRGDTQVYRSPWTGKKIHPDIRFTK